MPIVKASALWLLLLACAVLNGGLREAVLLPALGTPAAPVLSGVILSACVVLVALVFGRWLGRLGTAQALSVGLLWLGLTLVFEFSFGRLVQEQTWSQLLEAYTFKDGNLWPVVLVVILLAPLVSVRVRGGSPGKGAE